MLPVKALLSPAGGLFNFGHSRGGFSETGGSCNRRVTGVCHLTSEITL